MKPDSFWKWLLGTVIVIFALGLYQSGECVEKKPLPKSDARIALEALCPYHCKAASRAEAQAFFDRWLKPVADPERPRRWK